MSEAQEAAESDPTLGEARHVASQSGSTGKRRLSISGLAGYAVQVDVDPVATGWEVVEAVAAKLGRPVEFLMRTSGGAGTGEERRSHVRCSTPRCGSGRGGL